MKKQNKVFGRKIYLSAISDAYIHLKFHFGYDYKSIQSWLRWLYFLSFVYSWVIILFRCTF